MFNKTEINEYDNVDKLNRFFLVYLTGIIFSFVVGKIILYTNFEL